MVMGDYFYPSASATAWKAVVWYGPIVGTIASLPALHALFSGVIVQTLEPLRSLR